MRWIAAVSISHWGMFDVEASWLDRGDGFPGFYSEEMRLEARRALYRWMVNR